MREVYMKEKYERQPRIFIEGYDILITPNIFHVFIDNIRVKNIEMEGPGVFLSMSQDDSLIFFNNSHFKDILMMPTTNIQVTPKFRFIISFLCIDFEMCYHTFQKFEQFSF